MTELKNGHVLCVEFIDFDDVGTAVPDDWYRSVFESLKENVGSIVETETE